MKFKFSRGICVFLGIFIVFALSMSPTPGSGQLLKKGPIKAQVNPNLIEIYTRPKILPFRPFTYSDFKDPKTGQALKPDQMITFESRPAESGEVILSRPKPIRGDQFISEVNRREKESNSYGYSLRDRQEIMIGDIKVRADLLKSQENNILSKSIRFDPTKMTKPMDSKTIQNMNIENVRQAQVLKEDIKKAKPMKPLRLPVDYGPLHQDKSEYLPYGDPDTFAIYLKANAINDGPGDKITTFGTCEAGITMFNYNFAIFSVEASFDAPGPYAPDSNVQGHYYVNGVLGVSITHIDVNPCPNYAYNGDVPIVGVSQTLEIPFPVGPFTVVTRTGFRGEAGVNLNFSVCPFSIISSLNPHINTSAFIEVGIEILICEIGMGGNLTLLNDNFTLEGQIRVKKASPAAILPYQLVGTARWFNSSMESLSGKLYIYVKVDLWLWQKKWKFIICNWPGWRPDPYYIFDETKSTTV